jgi:transcriptional regulator with XRE-family HTH domain
MMKDEEEAHPLKVERERRGWSQAKVAEAVNTTVRTVSRWEQGQALPYPFYREQLCQLFGKDASQLGLLPDTIQELPTVTIDEAVVKAQMQEWYHFVEQS